jgi:hypothetical protein
MRLAQHKLIKSSIHRYAKNIIICNISWNGSENRKFEVRHRELSIGE